MGRKFKLSVEEVHTNQLYCLYPAERCFRVQIPLSFKVSFPLSLYASAPAPTVHCLESRLEFTHGLLQGTSLLYKPDYDMQLWSVTVRV